MRRRTQQSLFGQNKFFVLVYHYVGKDKQLAFYGIHIFRKLSFRRKRMNHVRNGADFGSGVKHYRALRNVGHTNGYGVAFLNPQPDKKARNGVYVAYKRSIIYFRTQKQKRGFIGEKRGAVFDRGVKRLVFIVQIKKPPSR